MKIREMKDVHPLPYDEVIRLNTYRHAANYLTAGQIYHFDIPHLNNPLNLEYINPGLPGRSATIPEINIIHSHISCLKEKRYITVVCTIQPKCSGFNHRSYTYLEATNSELYVPKDEEGRRRITESSNTALQYFYQIILRD